MGRENEVGHDEATSDDLAFVANPKPEPVRDEKPKPADFRAHMVNKRSMTAEEIFKQISDSSKYSPTYKTFIPHWTYVSPEVTMEVMNAGFKVYRGVWDGIMKDVLIIEW